MPTAYIFYKTKKHSASRQNAFIMLVYTVSAGSIPCRTCDVNSV